VLKNLFFCSVYVLDFLTQCKLILLPSFLRRNFQWFRCLSNVLGHKAQPHLLVIGE